MKFEFAFESEASAAAVRRAIKQNAVKKCFISFSCSRAGPEDLSPSEPELTSACKVIGKITGDQLDDNRAEI
jgi:hypothetical protein